MDLGSAVVADEQSFEVVQPGEGGLDDPADAAETGAVLGLAASDLRLDPALGGVRADICRGRSHGRRSPARAAGEAGRPCYAPRYPFHEWDELGDIVAVAAGERPGERDPGRVYEKVMLGAVSGSINRARARLGAPFFACT